MLTTGTLTITATDDGNDLILGEDTVSIFNPGDGTFTDYTVLSTNLQDIGTGDYSGAQDVDPGPGTAYLAIGAGGGSGVITVDLGAGGSNSLSMDTSWTYGQAISLQASGTNDDLAGTDGVNTWTLTGSNSGTLIDDSVGAVPITFSGLDTLTSVGDNDTVLGEDTANTWDLGDSVTYNGALTLQDFDVLQGGTDVDTFTVTGSSFGYSEALDGGAGDDVFDFQSYAPVFGAISGQGGTDTILFSAGFASPVSPILDASGDADGDSGMEYGSAAGGFSGIDVLTNNTGLSGLLQGNDTDSDWTVDATSQRYTSSGMSGPLTFSGFDIFQGGSGVDAFSIETDASLALVGGDGADTFSVGAGIALTGSITAQDGDDAIALGDGATVSGGVDGGAGTDILDLTAFTTGLDQAVASGDADGYGGTLAAIGTFAGIDDLRAGSGVNVLTGMDSASTWDLGGTTTYLLDSLSNALAFSGFGTLQGGTAADAFGVTVNSTEDLLGGDGADTFTLTAILTGSIDGEADDDTIAMGSGGSVSGTVAGGAGNDTLGYTGYGSAASVTLLNTGTTDGYDGSAVGTGGFSDIDVMQGSTGFTDTLTGHNGTSTWDLGASQTYTYNSVVLTFSAFDNLQGGSASDLFNIAAGTTANLMGGSGADTFDFTADNIALTGKIDGGIGTDILSYSGFTTSITVNMKAGSATGTRGYTAIESLVGGSGVDTLVGATRSNVWSITGTDTGTVTGMAFSSIGNLTGGGSADTFNISASGDLTGAINGGSGDDTLIGGGGDELDGGPGNDAFFLSRGTGNLLTITDPSGDDTLDFSAFSSGVSIELDPTGVRPIGDGLYLLLVGAFEHFNGSRFSDTLNVVERPGVRSVLGSLPSQKPGDRLIFDASGNVVDTSTPGLFIIGDAVLRYDEFETVSIINQAPVPTQAALAIDIRPSAGSVAVGQSLSFVLTVFNGGPGPATGVIVTDTLSGEVAVLSAQSDQGTARVSGNQLVFDLGSIASGASATAVVTVNPLSAGIVTNSATVRGVEPNPDPADAQASVTVAVVPLPDPIPPAIESLWRYGIHLHPTHLVLTFNETLSVTGAQDPHNYRLAGPGKDGRFGTADDLVIRLRPILYDPSRRDVILIPSRRLPLHHRFQLTVSGITNPAGLPLDGISGGSRVIRFQGRGIVYPETIPESRALLHGPRKSIRPRPHPISRHLHPARDLARR